LLSSISAFLSKLPVILTSIGAFSFLTILIKAEKLNSIITTVVTVITTLNVSLTLIKTIYSLIKPIEILLG
jgi:hypothetical protein